MAAFLGKDILCRVIAVYLIKLPSFYLLYLATMPQAQGEVWGPLWLPQGWGGSSGMEWAAPREHALRPASPLA